MTHPWRQLNKQNCLINYRFVNVPAHVHSEKPRKDTSEEILDGKSTEIVEGITTAIKAEKARPSGKVDLLPSEKQDDLDQNLLGLKENSDM